MSEPNVQEKLEAQLDEATHYRDGPVLRDWFRLAVVAVRCLVYIASALWDKDGAK